MRAGQALIAAGFVRVRDAHSRSGQCSFHAILLPHQFAQNMMDRPVGLHEDRGEVPPSITSAIYVTPRGER